MPSIMAIAADEAGEWFESQSVLYDLTNPTRPAPTGPAGSRALAAALRLQEFREAKAGPERRALVEPLDKALAAADAPASVWGYRFASLGENIAPADMARLAAMPGGWRTLARFMTNTAIGLEWDRQTSRAAALYAQVVALPLSELPENDPARLTAAAHQTALARRLRTVPAAAAVSSAPAVSSAVAEQCSLLDLRPVASNRPYSSNLYPMDAIDWAFEGAVRQAFDIRADGSVTDVRTVAAYPPFVFNKGMQTAAARLRYEPPMIGDTPVACNSQTLNINLRRPTEGGRVNAAKPAPKK